MRGPVRALALCALLLAPAPARGAWPHDPSIPLYTSSNAPLKTFTANAAAATGGGLLTTSIDSLSGVTVVRAQWFDTSGVARWGADGVTVASFTGRPLSPVSIASDGVGGAYVLYSLAGSPPADIRGYVARIRRDGSFAWGSPTAITNAAARQFPRAILLAGGSTVALWQHWNGTDYDLFAQRIDSTGTRQWGDGFAFATGPGTQDFIADGVARASGLTCLAWVDVDTWTAHAQEWDDNGQPQWAIGGVVIASTVMPHPTLETVPRIAVNGGGDMWVAWTDTRNGNGRERVYAQVLVGGAKYWTGDVMVSHQRAATAAGPPLPSPAGGVWFVWAEHESLLSASGQHVRAAWLAGEGFELTPPGGISLDAGEYGGLDVVGALDAAGALTCIVHDDIFGNGQRLRGQHVDGSFQTLAHRPLVTTDLSSLPPRVSVPDGSGGLYTLWRDAGTRVRLARVAAGGCLGGDPPALESVSDVAGDEGGVVQLCWQRACHDTAFTTLYRVLRRPAGTADPWTQVATYDAIGLAMNCYTAPTDADSGTGGAADYDWRIVWDDEVSETDSSNVVVGHSRDNLAPGPVGNVTVVFHPYVSLRPAGASPARSQFGSYNTVSWTASPSPDVAGIRVYRESWPGFTPSPANIVADLPASQLTVNDLADHAYYYKVVAVDDVGNTAPSAGAVSGGSDVVTVFSTDFESGMPSQMTAPGAAIEGTQGWAGLGPPGNQYGAHFLRYTSVPLYDTKLVLRNLPAHTHVSLGFLLAVIDSWDGTELFKVSVDGTTLFSHWFQLATGDTTSYVPAPGARLSAGTNLGFTNGVYYQHDRAYDLAVDPVFNNIPHTADTLAVVWFLGAVSGPAASQWQGGGDESWAIDNVRVKLTIPTAGVPGAEAPSRLALAGAQPNPSRDGRLSIHFALPSSADARLELFDVSGRRLASRDVGAMGAGRHDVDLAEGRPFAAGVYLVRLTQGAMHRTVRVAVMR